MYHSMTFLYCTLNGRNNKCLRKSPGNIIATTTQNLSACIRTCVIQYVDLGTSIVRDRSYNTSFVYLRRQNCNYLHFLVICIKLTVKNNYFSMYSSRAYLKLGAGRIQERNRRDLLLFWLRKSCGLSLIWIGSRTFFFVIVSREGEGMGKYFTVSESSPCTDQIDIHRHTTIHDHGTTPVLRAHPILAGAPIFGEKTARPDRNTLAARSNDSERGVGGGPSRREIDCLKSVRLKTR